MLNNIIDLPIRGVSINWDKIDGQSYQITKMYLENKDELLRRLLSEDVE